MPAVRLDAVSKLFPGGGGIRDISLDVPAGEHLVVVGPSGAGKTTLLRAIAGLQPIDSGRISFASKEVTADPPHRRQVTFIGQRPALYPHLMVRRNLSIGLELRQGWAACVRGPWQVWVKGRAGDGLRKHGTRTKEIGDRVDAAADWLGLTALLDRMPQGLSGGEQQRVVIGRAVVSQHPLWLLDEPLAHLDPASQEAVRAELLLLRERLTPTIIEVTHDPAEARSLGHRVAVLAGGRLVQAGPPAEVYARPQSRDAATSLGWPPMNFIEGSLAAPDAGAPARSRAVLGVRAEDVQVGPAPSGAADLGGWAVARTEPHGPGELWRMTRGLERLKRWARPGESPDAAQNLFVAADRCHWFDPKTGERLTD